MFSSQNTTTEPAITEVCANYCTGGNCRSYCSSNNPFRINNIVSGANYTISISLRNDFGQSGESNRTSYGEVKTVSVIYVRARDII